MAESSHRVARAHVLVLMIVAVVLVGVWTAVIAIDVLDVLGLRSRLFEERDSDLPYLFFHLAYDRGPMEWLQWALLGIGAVVAARAGGERTTVSADQARRLTAFALLLGLLALKDSGSPRHEISHYVRNFVGETAAVAAELAVLAIVGGAAVTVLVLVWPVTEVFPRPRRSLLLGYVAYASAAGMSATSRWWYDAAGLWVRDRVFDGRMLPVGRERVDEGFLLMDTLVEESIELVGAALLCATAIAFLQEVRAAPAPPQDIGTARQ